jgi:hypothetical protein
MVLMRVWPDSDEPLASGKNEWKLKLEAWLVGIPIIFGIAVAIWSLF